MSYLTNFNQFNFKTKTVLITIIGQIPFFYIAVYLFQKPLINRVSVNLLSDLNFWFIAMLCIALSVCWYAVNLLLTIISVDFISTLENDNIEANLVLIITTALSLIYLPLAIVGCYYFQLSFSWFLLISFCWVLFRILWTGVFSVIQKIRSYK